LSVRIRLTRIGRKNRPFYRIGAYDNRTRRDGAPIERLGHYDPLNPKEEEQVHLELDRIKHWLSVGAQPSETVASLVKKAGVELPAKRGSNRNARQRAKAKKKG
jgi:small subunit ribosomal protein S16